MAANDTSVILAAASSSSWADDAKSSGPAVRIAAAKRTQKIREDAIAAAAVATFEADVASGKEDVYPDSDGTESEPEPAASASAAEAANGGSKKRKGGPRGRPKKHLTPEEKELADAVEKEKARIRASEARAKKRRENPGPGRGSQNHKRKGKKYKKDAEDLEDLAYEAKLRYLQKKSAAAASTVSDELNEKVQTNAADCDDLKTKAASLTVQQASTAALVASLQALIEAIDSLLKIHNDDFSKRMAAIAAPFRLSQSSESASATSAAAPKPSSVLPPPAAGDSLPAPDKEFYIERPAAVAAAASSEALDSLFPLSQLSQQFN